MSSPRERLERLIAAHIPSEVVFRVAKQQEGDILCFEAIVVKERSWVGDESDAELKVALISEIAEQWDAANGKYIINTSVDMLWSRIKRVICSQYEKFSTRCNATKRKTDLFIRGIDLDDKYLPNFLIQVFLTIEAPTYQDKTRVEREALFEQFESLRRTYGKRSK